MNTDPLVFEYLYRAPAGRVWSAITEAPLLRRWLFEQIPAFKPEPGSYTEFSVVFEGKHFLHQWTVLEAVPATRLVVRWRYAGYSGDSRTIWELSEAEGLTKLTLTVEGLESFPQNIPEFTRESCTAGWTFLLGSRLNTFLEELS